METIEVTTQDQLDELYKDSALTFEGVVMSEVERFRDYFTGWTSIDKTQPCYHITGKVMNDMYGLVGSNRYKDDLDIICFKLNTFKEPQKIVIVRFEIGGRWFSDVVDNNARRNQELLNI